MKHVLFCDLTDSPFESSGSFVLSRVALMCSE